MHRKRGFRLRSNSLLTAVALLFSTAASAEVYFCKDAEGVSIDQYGISSAAEEFNEFEYQEWVVDTEKGWRRADLANFGGACESKRGYVVCRADNIAFGEATFSIHPDGANFILVYIDYGMNALAFVGKCTQK
ncbi:MAG: DUF4124 domain-containing protein [Gammaproteobacteria bacterium]|nr:DUF4124 domain-containing protein [Gammaproteobacteria bacterium]